VPRRTFKAKDEFEDEEIGPGTAPEPLGSLVKGAPLEPIRYVDRELTHPDGTKLRVRVPVYPPFRLEERPAPKPAPEPRKRAPAEKKAS
jgi:hypothetical protein